MIREHPVILPHTCVHCWVRGIGGNYYDDGGDDDHEFMIIMVMVMMIKSQMTHTVVEG